MSAGEFSIDVIADQGRTPVTIFSIRGDIDVRTYERLQAEATRAVEAGTRNLLLDLSEVAYISSAGLRALHAIYSLLRAADPTESAEVVQRGLRDGSYTSPHLKLLNPSPSVDKVLRAAGFDMYLEIYTSLPQALASL